MKSGVTTWPNGSRIAIALTVMFETWPEGKWPPYAAQRWQPKPGALDHQSITFAQYGGKAGIWRILNILDKAGMPATFCTNAHSVEVYPDAAKQVVKCGHDFAAHGYRVEARLQSVAHSTHQGTDRPHTSCWFCHGHHSTPCLQLARGAKTKAIVPQNFMDIKND